MEVFNMNTNNETSGNQPEKKFRAGAISATVWQNQSQNKKTGEALAYRTISIERCYKDKQDQWQNTNSLRINDLPRAALVLTKAYEYLVMKGQALSAITEEVVM